MDRKTPFLLALTFLASTTESVIGSGVLSFQLHGIRNFGAHKTPFPYISSSSRPHISRQVFPNFDSDDNDDVGDDASTHNRRRRLLTGLVFSRPSFLIYAAALASPSPAAAARGAFELDAEYYLRSALTGNARVGPAGPSPRPPPPPPRTLSGPAWSAVVGEGADGSEGLIVRGLASVASRSGSDVAAAVRKYMDDGSVRRSFWSARPWSSSFDSSAVDPSLSNEYYFDFYCYAVWRAAADLLQEDYVRRDRFVRDVGRDLWVGTIKPKTDLPTGNLQPSVICDKVLTAVLDTLREGGMIKSYQFGNSNGASGDYDDAGTKMKGKEKKDGTESRPPQQPVLDTIDDDFFAAGSSLDVVLTLVRPATLGSSLQITGEGSRFSPDLVSPVITAAWEDLAGANVKFESYFVDGEYRPNPKDFFPDEQLLQFTITKAK
uniref:Uncharacterized protein n=1 Tax=Corethron hystrix TaxID=216773 RepID=A0A7S1BIH4_9STRA|mmetsp:Transcript_27416/g.62955  ORF Transcript_27416/g.62955 Transcript_27416/m.62955 type:complete len:434 (+) Transcript_27416:29-1330(+)